MTVSLSQDLEQFIEQEVKKGHYRSTNEVICQALRLLVNHEETKAQTLDFLKTAWHEGISSPDIGDLDFAALKKTARQQAGY